MEIEPLIASSDFTISILFRVGVSAWFLVEFLSESANLFQYVELKKGMSENISGWPKLENIKLKIKIMLFIQIRNLHFHDAQAMKFCSSTVKASPFRAQISRLLISAQVDRRFEIRFWNLSKTIFSSFGVKLYWSEDETSFCIWVFFSTVLLVLSSINFILNWFCGISYSGLAALPSFETFSGFRLRFKTTKLRKLANTRLSNETALSRSKSGSWNILV